MGSHVADAVAAVVGELDGALGAVAGDDGPAPVGVGAPGMVDRHGRLCFAPNLPQAHGVDWTELIGDRLPGRAVLIENDANFAVLAEHRLGAARGYRHVAHGDARHRHRRRHRDGRARAGRRGRVRRGDRAHGGRPGRTALPLRPTGLLGALRVRRRLGLLAREAALAGKLDEVVRLAGGDPENVRGEDVSAAAAAGDPAARRVIHEVGWWVGFGLANLAATLDPECFVLGGGLSQAGDLLVDSARVTFDELVEGGDRRPLAGDRARRVRRACRRGRCRAGGPPGWVVVMRTGVVLPTFRDTPDEAFDAAAKAVAAGVDGLFCYDHIWPLGQPERPALAPFPVLGALATLPRRAAGTARSWARWWRASGSRPTPCWRRSSARSTAWRPAASSPASAPATT